MAAMLGAEGTLKGTFVAFMQAKKSVTLEMLRGEPITGLVIGANDEHVVIDRQWTSSSGMLAKKQFLACYAAIVTITEGPARLEERAAG
jgi:hypothetical protein